MAATPRAPAPAWTRRVQGWSFLLFFVSLIALTFVAVVFYNANQLALSGYFAALASVLPLLLVVLVYYGLPVWGLSVPMPPDAVASALASSAKERRVEPVEEREGPFARCVAVVRFADPPCTLGWSAEQGTSPADATRKRSLLVLRPETRDRRAVAALRESLRASLVRQLGPSS